MLAWQKCYEFVYLLHKHIKFHNDSSLLNPFYSQKPNSFAVTYSQYSLEQARWCRCQCLCSSLKRKKRRKKRGFLALFLSSCKQRWRERERKKKIIFKAAFSTGTIYGFWTFASFSLQISNNNYNVTWSDIDLSKVRLHESVPTSLW